ncbi:MAG: hypothetical protein KatS3mg008_1051 [Acidimicrobiales bacterium]|nr:MAG: hypothetical protein KatS3mg008_1051 [Acidimicrobiales bacterium]
MARVCPSPAVTCAQSLSVPTRVGVRRVVVSPSPSWPWVLSPHAQRVPSRLMPMVWLLTAAICAQSLSVPTRVGVRRVVVSPSPSWPNRLSPHAQRLRSVFVVSSFRMVICAVGSAVRMPGVLVVICRVAVRSGPAVVSPAARRGMRADRCPAGMVTVPVGLWKLTPPLLVTCQLTVTSLLCALESVIGMPTSLCEPVSRSSACMSPTPRRVWLSAGSSSSRMVSVPLACLMVPAETVVMVKVTPSSDSFLVSPYTRTGMSALV